MRCFVIAVNLFFATPHSLVSTLADDRSKMTRRDEMRRQPCSPDSGHLLSTEIDTGCENNNAFVSCRPAGEAHAHCATLETPDLICAATCSSTDASATLSISGSKTPPIFGVMAPL
jgi:hypothetical protein